LGPMHAYAKRQHLLLRISWHTDAHTRRNRGGGIVCKRERELLSHLTCLQMHAMQAEVRMCIATVRVCSNGMHEGIDRAWWTRVDAWCVCVCVCVCPCGFKRTVCGSKSACVASCPPDLSAVSVAPPVATCARGHAVISGLHVAMRAWCRSQCMDELCLQWCVFAVRRHVRPHSARGKHGPPAFLSWSRR
jgi:hypothetical protein